MVDGVSVKAISADIFPEWEPRLDWHLSSFCDRSGGSLERGKLISDIMARHYQCWVVLEGDEVKACALTFVQDDATKTCVLSHCAGRDFEQWADQLVATIKVWSHSIGSTKLEAIARPGWERALKSLGMVKTHIILELKNG